jgi:hypothetical protein
MDREGRSQIPYLHMVWSYSKKTPKTEVKDFFIDLKIQHSNRGWNPHTYISGFCVHQKLMHSKKDQENNHIHNGFKSIKYWEVILIKEVEVLYNKNTKTGRNKEDSRIAPAFMDLLQ